MKHKLIFIALMSLDFAGFSQPPDAAPSNYVVVGAFAIQNNATQFVENVRKLSYNPISAINTNRKLYYVYVLRTDNRKAAFSEAGRIRKASPFTDTWVYMGVLGADGGSPGSDLNPLTEKAVAKVEIADLKPAILPVEEEKTKAEETPPDTATVTAPPKPAATPVAEVANKPVVPDAEPGGKNFVFRIFTAQDQKELDGDIDVIDVDRARKISTFKGNQNVVVKSLNKSGKLSLICEVFGYRKVQQDLNFNKPGDTPGAVVEGNQTIVPFELTRLKKGDISVMYSVYFFNDAAVMRPESRSEVTNLMEMMNDNPKYKIRIHGHTNGSAAGKIISMGESKKFFSLEGTHDGYGSAKKLSEERAKVIREFLISGGVDAKRMEIKAWGGKHPIHDKSSAQARSNVRVEIEIVEDK